MTGFLVRFISGPLAWSTRCALGNGKPPVSLCIHGVTYDRLDDAVSKDGAWRYGKVT